jgi:hypothetical protein
MKTALAFVLPLWIIAAAVIAWILCFEATYFGGWLPFLTLVAAPIITYAIGRQDAYIESRRFRTTSYPS